MPEELAVEDAPGASRPGLDRADVPPDLVTLAPAALSLFTRIADVVHGPAPVSEKLDFVVRTAITASAATNGAFVWIDDASGLLSASSGNLGLSMIDDATRSEIIRSCLRNGEPLVASPAFRGARRAGAPDDEVTSVLAVPAPRRAARPHGAIVLGRFDGEFGEHEIAAVRALAAHLGVALDNLSTLERLSELEAAQREVVHSLQEAVRPPMPTGVESTELGVHYLAADPHSPTGGDLYDWQVLPDGDLHLAVVDVLGKGVAATKDALSVTHVLRLLALDGCALERLVSRADQLLGSQNPDLVATVVIGRYTPHSGVLRLVGGGHPPPLWISDEREVRQVAVPGIPIGWPGAGSSEVVTMTLGRRDTVILYTDGLVEATKDILEGLARLEVAAAETARYPAPHLARALVERALEGAQRRDDSLVLVLRRRTPPVAEPESTLGPFSYRFSPSLANISLVRHFLADWLTLQGVEGTDHDDLLLVASELSSNAVRAASGAPGALALRARVDGDAIVIEVHDDGKGLAWAPLDADALPDPEADQGRGLFLVTALSDAVEIIAGDPDDAPGTTVRAVKRAVMPDASPQSQ